MVNVFGESTKGQRGEEGQPGKDALPIAKWFPDQVVEWWRNQSDAAFYFNELKSGFIYKNEEITGLKNHSKTWKKRDAISKGEIGDLKKLPIGYSLDFKNSLYYIPELSLAFIDPSTSCITLSFRISTLPTGREYIINTNNGRGLSIEGQKIQVWGCINEPVEVPLYLDEWNIIFIQWKNSGDSGDNAGYVYNSVDPIKQFVTSKSKHVPKCGLYIGKDFNGCICAIDITTHVQSIPEIPDNIPIEIRDLLIDDHSARAVKYREQWMEVET